MNTDPFHTLRALNPAPTSQAPSIDGLWSRLDRAAAVDAAADRPVTRARRARAWGSRVMVAAMVGVALAVAAGAVVLLHGPRAQTNHPATVQQSALYRTLGVLRRPASAADRDLKLGHPFPLSEITAIDADARLATTANRIGSIVLVPVRRQGGPLELGVTGSAGGGCCSTVREIKSGEAVQTGSNRSSAYGFVIVPDGVAKVAVTDGDGIDVVQVHNNVAVFTFSRPTDDLASLPMTWFNRSGEAIRSFHAPPVTVSRTQRLQRILTTVGIASTPFGSSVTAVRRRLDPVLGAPVKIGAQDSCDYNEALTWPNFVTASGRVTTAEPLTAYFLKGRFAGYQYGTNTLAPRGAGHLRLRATTQAGIALGDPVDGKRILDGGQFTPSAAQGGSWTLSIRDERFAGYLADYRFRDGKVTGRIASIDAGATGCPAASP